MACWGKPYFGLTAWKSKLENQFVELYAETSLYGEVPVAVADRAALEVTATVVVVFVVLFLIRGTASADSVRVSRAKNIANALRVVMNEECMVILGKQEQIISLRDAKDLMVMVKEKSK
jgi:hypothetical protein